MPDRGPTISPTLRYRDARAAITFLEQAFGFEPAAVHEGPDGEVAHAELAFDGGLVMLGTAADQTDGAPYWGGMIVAAGGFGQQPAANVAPAAGATSAVLAPQTASPAAVTTAAPKAAAPQLAQAKKPQLIQSAAGAVTKDLHGHITASGSDPYLLAAKAGQVLQVALVSPQRNVVLSITGVADAIAYKRAENGAAVWKGVLPHQQTYLIKAIAIGDATDYNLHVVLK